MHPRRQEGHENVAHETCRSLAIALGLLGLCCGGPTSQADHETARSATEPAETEVSAEVNRHWPEVSRLDQQERAIAAASRSLGTLRTPQLSIQLARTELDGALISLLPRLARTLVLDEVDRIELHEIAITPELQTLTIQARFQLRLVREDIAIQGQIRGSVSLASSRDGLRMYPTFDHVQIEPITTGSDQLARVKATVVVVALQRFIATLNQVMVAQPPSIALDVGPQAVQAATRVLGLHSNLHLTPADATFTFSAELGETAILIGPDGIGLLAELIHTPGSAERPAPRWLLETHDEPRRDKPTADQVRARRAAVEAQFAELAARFEQVRRRSFPAQTMTSTSIAITRKALSDILERGLNSAAICLEQRGAIVAGQRFREELRAYKRSDIHCSHLRKSCDCDRDCSRYRGQASKLDCRRKHAQCVATCNVVHAGKVAACNVARTSIKLLNGLMKIGTLEGQVDAVGVVRACPRRVEIADDLSRVSIETRTTGRADVTVQLSVDTDGAGHLLCVFPFSRNFRAQATVEQDVTIDGRIDVAVNQTGSAEIQGTFRSEMIRVSADPSPWEQMASDPKFALNCSFLGVGLQAVDVISALVGKKAPAGVTALTRGDFELPVPDVSLRLPLDPVHIHLGSDQLLLQPTWHPQWLHFELSSQKTD